MNNLIILDSWFLVNEEDRIISPRDVIIVSFYIKGFLENKTSYKSDKVIYVDKDNFFYTKNDREKIVLKTPSELYKNLYGFHVKSVFIHVMRGLSFLEHKYETCSPCDYINYD